MSWRSRWGFWWWVAAELLPWRTTLVIGAVLGLLAGGLAAYLVGPLFWLLGVVVFVVVVVVVRVNVLRYRDSATPPADVTREAARRDKVSEVRLERGRRLATRGRRKKALAVLATVENHGIEATAKQQDAFVTALIEQGRILATQQRTCEATAKFEQVALTYGHVADEAAHVAQALAGLEELGRADEPVSVYARSRSGPEHLPARENNELLARAIKANDALSHKLGGPADPDPNNVRFNLRRVKEPHELRDAPAPARAPAGVVRLAAPAGMMWGVLPGGERSHLFLREQGTAVWPGWTGLCGAARSTNTLGPGRKRPPCEACTKVISLG